MKKSYLLIFSIFAVLYSFAGNNFPLKNHGENYSNSFLPPLLPDVTIVASTNNICVNSSITSITFTASISFGSSTSYNYTWKRNGNTVRSGTSFDVLVTSDYADGDVFTCVVKAVGTLTPTSASNEEVITVNNSRDTTATACTVFFFRGRGPYTRSGVYSEAFSNGSGCDSVINIYLTISRPAKPTITSANREVCSFVGSSVNYSIASPNNTYYHKWTAPYSSNAATPWSATIVSGQGASTAELSFTSNLANKSLYLQVYDSNEVTGCVSDADSLLLTMTLPVVDAIIGTSNPCGSQLTGVTYTAVPGLNSADITGYLWTVAADTATIMTGQGTNSITVDFNSILTYTSIKVKALSNCGSRTARGINIVKQNAPSAPYAIQKSFTPSVTAVTNACGLDSSTYRIRKMTNATSYDWSLSSGAFASIVHLGSGANDTAIRVIFNPGFTQDDLSVSCVSSCGSSIPKTITISTISLTPPAVTAIEGEISPCIGSSYSYTATAAIPAANQSSVGKFRWTRPANTTLVSANSDSSSVSIRFNAGYTGGSITVKAQSICGITTGIAKSIVLKYGTPTVSSITGSTTPCIGQTTSYAATPTNTTASQNPISVYRWVRPANTTITNASGDSSTITVSFNTGYAGGAIKSYGISSSCDFAGSSKTLQLRHFPPTPNTVTSSTGNLNACIGQSINYTVTTPTPTTSQQTVNKYRWTKPANTSITSGNSDSSTITLQFNSGYVGGTLVVKAQSACGVQGSQKAVSLTHTACATGTKSTNLITKSETGSNSEIFSVNVYPNPSQSGFNLKINSLNKSNASIKVMDLQGKTITKLNANSGEIISFGNMLTPGTYMVETRQGNLIKTSRIVKY